MTRWSQLLILMALLVGAAFITSYSYTIFHFVRAPLVLLSARIENSYVKYGEPLIVEEIFERAAYCKSDVDRFILLVPEMKVVRRERLPAGIAGAIGNSIIRVPIPTKFPSQAVIPFGIADLAVQDLFPGNSYVLRIFLHSDCGDRTHTLSVPDMNFTVTE